MIATDCRGSETHTEAAVDDKGPVARATCRVAAFANRCRIGIHKGLACGDVTGKRRLADLSLARPRTTRLATIPIASRPSARDPSAIHCWRHWHWHWHWRWRHHRRWRRTGATIANIAHARVAADWRACSHFPRPELATGAATVLNGLATGKGCAESFATLKGSCACVQLIITRRIVARSRSAAGPVGATIDILETLDGRRGRCRTWRAAIAKASVAADEGAGGHRPCPKLTT
mmetsp:Transcript_60095/g.122610  ORF Transcript_60095/g.122610 Transcript_60095/m.122610 type:complete len:233 (+) Transcript_60095:651-1349(+)